MHYREGDVKSLGVFYPRRAWGHARKIGKSSGWGHEVQVPEPGILVSGILRGYGKERTSKKSQRISGISWRKTRWESS